MNCMHRAPTEFAYLFSKSSPFCTNFKQIHCAAIHAKAFFNSLLERFRADQPHAAGPGVAHTPFGLLAMPLIPIPTHNVP